LALLTEPLQMVRASAGVLLIDAMMKAATRTPRDGKLTFMVSPPKTHPAKMGARKLVSLVDTSTRITNHKAKYSALWVDA
jgi:hypothetical protein